MNYEISENNIIDPAHGALSFGGGGVKIRGSTVPKELRVEGAVVDKSARLKDTCHWIGTTLRSFTNLSRTARMNRLLLRFTMCPQLTSVGPRMHCSLPALYEFSQRGNEPYDRYTTGRVTVSAHLGSPGPQSSYLICTRHLVLLSLDPMQNSRSIISYLS